MRAWRGPSLLAALLLLAACGEAESERAGRLAVAIAGGYEDANDTAVMAIAHLPSGLLCSGSLIAPNVVLTARHCVSPVLNGNPGVSCDTTSFDVPMAAGGFSVTRATTVTAENVDEYLVTEVQVVPNSSSLFCGFDVAVLILSENVSATTAAPLVPRIDQALVAGESFSAVGYGAVDEADTGAGVRRRRDDLAVLCVGVACDGHEAVGPGVVMASEWAGEGAVCNGDSGGPALHADTAEVVGVTSRGSFDCGLGVWGSVESWSGWLKDMVVYASGMGVYPAPSWTEGSSVNPEHSAPMGEPCTSAADCPSGRCISDAGNFYCTRACEQTSHCPDGYVCSDLQGERVCAATGRPAPVSYQRPDKEGTCALVARRKQPGELAGWLLLAAVYGSWRVRRRRRGD